jgi:hypothetical protein
MSAYYLSPFAKNQKTISYKAGFTAETESPHPLRA